MSVVFYRIDDRLIHGQVMTGWARDLSATHIYVVDDKVAKDPFLQQVLTMAAPKEIKVGVLNVADSVAVLQNDPPENKTIVLTKTPEVMMHLADAGLPMKDLNVGGMCNAPGRKMVLRNIQVSPDELEVLKQIAAKGVRVFFQIVPGDKSLELDKVKL